MVGGGLERGYNAEEKVDGSKENWWMRKLKKYPGEEIRG